MKAKITNNLAETETFEKLLAKLPAGKKQPVQLDIWDTLVTGLALRISSNDTKTWVVRYRKAGKRYRMALGRFPEVGVADARDEAKRCIGKVADRRNPVQEVHEARQKAEAEKTFAEVAAIFMKRHAVHRDDQTHREYQRELDHDILPVWGSWKISSIKRSDVFELLDSIIDRGSGYMANRLRSLINTIFRFAEDREYVARNPAARIKDIHPEEPRKRALDEDEIRRLFKVLETAPARHQIIVRAALLTAARKSELIGMPWLELKGEWWTIPGDRTKNGRDHRIYMVPSVLEALPKQEGPHVFERGRRWLIQANWFRDLLAKANIKDARFHDLRRSASTMMNKIGIDRLIVERILNHKVMGDVEATYNVHSYDAEKRAALLKWERHLDKIIIGDDMTSDKVVAIAGTR